MPWYVLNDIKVGPKHHNHKHYGWIFYTMKPWDVASSIPLYYVITHFTKHHFLCIEIGKCFVVNRQRLLCNLIQHLNNKLMR